MKSSAPATTTRMRPSEKVNPARSRVTPNARSEVPAVTVVAKSAPSAMNAPARTASAKTFGAARAAFATPMSSACGPSPAEEGVEPSGRKRRGAGVDLGHGGEFAAGARPPPGGSVVSRDTCWWSARMPRVRALQREESATNPEGQPMEASKPFIVVGTDGSPHAERALEFAAEEARRRDAIVHVVTAWHVPAAVYRPGFAPMVNPSLEESTQRPPRTSPPAQRRVCAPEGLEAETSAAMHRRLTRSSRRPKAPTCSSSGHAATVASRACSSARSVSNAPSTLLVRR